MAREVQVREVCDKCGREVVFSVPTASSPLGAGWRHVEVKEFDTFGEPTVSEHRRPWCLTLCPTCVPLLVKWTEEKEWKDAEDAD